jgi:hypothetical protein
VEPNSATDELMMVDEDGGPEIVWTKSTGKLLPEGKTLSLSTTASKRKGRMLSYLHFFIGNLWCDLFSTYYYLFVLFIPLFLLCSHLFIAYLLIL